MKFALPVRIIAILTFAVGGCATSKPMMGPNGKQAYYVKCHSAAIDKCYEEAASVCPRGYAFADRGNNAPGVIVPVGNVLIAGRGPTTMLIECKE